MFIWIVLFLVIVGISFALALRSMSDFQTQPSSFNINYSLYLINKPQALTPQVMELLHSSLLADKLIISFEKLFKGTKHALVVFGPVVKLKPLMETLGLLELEDYSKKVGEEVLAWEMTVKSSSNSGSFDLNNLIPSLGESEQFWLQFVLKPESTAKTFEAGLRALLQASGRARALQLQTQILEAGKARGLVLLPQAYSATQLVDFYQTRRQVAHALTKIPKVDFTVEEIVSILN